MTERFYRDRLTLRPRGEASEPADIVERLRDTGLALIDRGSVSSGRTCNDAADEIERLCDALKEADDAIRELQQAACDRAGVPMPSQRPVVERQQNEIERLRDALIVLGAAEAAPRGREKYERLMAARKIARVALGIGKARSP